MLLLHQAGRAARLRLGRSSQLLGLRGVFVSAHYKLQRQDVLAYLDRRRVGYSKFDDPASGQVTVRNCPACRATYKLRIDLRSGAYACDSCSTHGSWFDLKHWLGDLSDAPVASVLGQPELLDASSHADAASAVAGVDGGMSRVAAALQTLSQDTSGVLQHLTQDRRLLPETLAAYRVGLEHHSVPSSTGDESAAADMGSSDSLPCLMLPYLEDAPVGSEDSELVPVGVKLRALTHDQQHWLEPRTWQGGLFGWHTVPADARDLVITGSEFDAMSVHQATGAAAVALPRGSQTLPVSLLPRLERFRRLYLWLDDDVIGLESARAFAGKLGIERCFIVHGDGMHRDANAVLRAGGDVAARLAEATAVPHEQIVTFDELRDEVYRELAHPEQTAGVQCRSLPSLNTTLKGLRRGELTVLTGPTGVGKTSILSQLSLDYARQGVPTLWGSFEIKNVRLAKKMLTQFVGQAPEAYLPRFEHHANAFAQIPLRFLRFMGSTELDQLLDAMEYAVYVYDVGHIVLDNLQFMMSGQGRGMDKFENQDIAIQRFRSFATAQNVHISLVVHPRKVKESEALDISSVFGSAKATQEADNVLILQRDGGSQDGTPMLQIKKNRYDGELGSIPLSFNKDCQVFVEQDAAVAADHHQHLGDDVRTVDTRLAP